MVSRKYIKVNNIIKSNQKYKKVILNILKVTKHAFMLGIIVGNIYSFPVLFTLKLQQKSEYFPIKYYFTWAFWSSAGSSFQVTLKTSKKKGGKQESTHLLSVKISRHSPRNSGKIGLPTRSWIWLVVDSAFFQITDGWFWIWHCRLSTNWARFWNFGGSQKFNRRDSYQRWVIITDNYCINLQTLRREKFSPKISPQSLNDIIFFWTHCLFLTFSSYEEYFLSIRGKNGQSKVALDKKYSKVTIQ